MKLFILLILILASSNSFADGVITTLLHKNQLKVTLNEPLKTDQVIIVSRTEDQEQANAIGHVVKTISKTEVVIEVEEILSNNLILVGDIVYPLEYKLLKKKKILGFAASKLIHKSGHKVPSRYTDLAYFGALTAEGHTLSKSEFLVSPFQIQYGVTDKFGLRFINALWFDEYINLGLKYRVMKNKYATITLNGFGAHNVAQKEWLTQVGGMITIPQNAKFNNNFSVNLRLDPEATSQSSSPISRGISIFQDSDIKNIMEYITDDWDRILFGPVYNIELKSFGGTISYMWIWDNFHLSLGLATRDFAELKVGSKGYYAVYDLFWRF